MEELRKITTEYDELSDKVTILVREPQGKDRAAHIVPPTQCKLAFSRQVAFIPFYTIRTTGPCKIKSLMHIRLEFGGWLT